MTSFFDNFEEINHYPGAERVVGYNQFWRLWAVELRRYFQEKIAIGILDKVDVLMDSTPEFRVCFILQGVHPKMWETVLVPGIRQYARLADSKTVSQYNDTLSIWLRVKEKPL